MGDDKGRTIGFGRNRSQKSFDFTPLMWKEVVLGNPGAALSADKRLNTSRIPLIDTNLP